MEYKTIGYFMMGAELSGSDASAQICPVIALETGLDSFEDMAPDKYIGVLCTNHKWYIIKKSELILTE